MQIRPASPADADAILALYREVAAVPGGIARSPDEVSPDYVAGFMARAAAGGLELVAVSAGRVVGEIHCAPAGLACFSSVLGDLTIAIAPAAQGCGLGRQLFQTLLATIVRDYPHIGRVELMVRASNTRAQALYRALGFVEEGRLRQRIRNPLGQLEDDVAMGWLRPEAV
ncbi:GNAT family N-acetyltransferase [Massilia sp. TS11]|uniref:GNAT family N-acetyltransferase n=1 Tax=Massilia sp. TS11 TaxID=2908003 RepID=UPI001EDA246B|nr:N-acetyltransferase [Massilia sp. TS11]MCG2585288.1 GNAT family N-acetyltransferase [Massilia sp. TS11]